MRRVARYSVGLYDNDLKVLQRAGAVRLLDGDTYELVDPSLYREGHGTRRIGCGREGSVPLKSIPNLYRNRLLQSVIGCYAAYMSTLITI